MRSGRRGGERLVGRVLMSAEQEAVDRVLVTWAGASAVVVAEHLSTAWAEVGSSALDDVTLKSWSERISAGHRVIVPLG